MNDYEILEEVENEEVENEEVEEKKTKKVIGFIKKHGKKLALGASGAAVVVGAAIIKSKLSKNDYECIEDVEYEKIGEVEVNDVEVTDF